MAGTQVINRAVSAAAERMIRRACRGLPEDQRDRRVAEWSAELPAIVIDPDVRFAPLRILRLASYTAGVARAAHRERTRRETWWLFTGAFLAWHFEFSVTNPPPIAYWALRGLCGALSAVFSLTRTLRLWLEPRSDPVSTALLRCFRAFDLWYATQGVGR